MLPDAPTVCPVCGAGLSHDSEHYPNIKLTARVFECGGAVCIADGGRLYPALACPKSGAVIAQLRADLASSRMELQAIADVADEHLGAWATAPLSEFGYLYDLKALRTALDLAVEALEGQPTAPAAEVSHEPLSSGSASLNVPAAEPVGERS